MFRKFLILSASAVVFCATGFAGGDQVPPEVTPRVKESLPAPVEESDGVNAPTPTKSPAKAPKKDKTVCGPNGQEMVEGKCMCEKPSCPAVQKCAACKKCAPCKKTVCPKAAPAKKCASCPEPAPAKPCPSCPEPTVKEVKVETKVRDDTAYDRWNITGFYGKGPEGVDRVVYRDRAGGREYKAYRDYGDVFGGVLSYKFTRSFNVSGMYLSNETKMVGLGFSF